MEIVNFAINNKKSVVGIANNKLLRITIYNVTNS